MVYTLTCVADLGSSLGKGCYTIDKGPPNGAEGFVGGFQRDTPRKGWITQANAVDEEKHRDLAPDSCIIEIRGRTWTVGESACYGLHETRIRAAKSNMASIRVLGMLGKVIEQENFTEGSLDLRVLLPVGERKSFQQLEDNLTKALYEVRLNGIKPSLRINRVRVYPEGAGVAQSVTVPDALVLMFGHKDISIVPVRNQVIQSHACQTITGMGMIALINEFPCPINDELLLAEFLHLEAVGKGGLERLLGEGNLENLDRAKADFQQAKKKTWRRILQQLMLEPKVKTASKIYVTGGSMRVWFPELKETFGSRLAFFTDSLKSMIAAYPDMQKPKNKEIKPRFTDSFLLMEGANHG